MLQRLEALIDATQDYELKGILIRWWIEARVMEQQGLSTAIH